MWGELQDSDFPSHMCKSCFCNHIVFPAIFDFGKGSKCWPLLVSFKIAVCQGLCKPRTVHWYHPKCLHKLQPCWAPQKQKQGSEQTKASFFRQPHSVLTSSCISLSWRISLSKDSPLTNIHQCRFPTLTRVAVSPPCVGAGEVLRKRQNQEALWNEMLQTSNWKVQELNTAWQELIHERQLCAESNRPSLAVLVCSV